MKHSNVTKDSLVLFLLDSHQSYLTVKLLDLSKENGVLFLSFHPRTTHKLQPFDRSVCGAFRKVVSNLEASFFAETANLATILSTLCLKICEVM
jgi:hypothetical protein